jgi:autotransporter translocation and assembly factor TamB
MRVVRRLTHVLILLLTLMVGATAAAIIVSQTAWFKDWLRGYIVREANNYLNGELQIERLGGNLFFGVEMENVAVSLDGEQVVSVQDLGLDYNVFEMISRGLSVDEIRLNRPVLYLRREGDTWSITRLVKKQEQEADREGPQYPIAIDGIGISDASIVVDDPVGTSGVDVPDRIDRLDARLAFKYEPVHYSIEITHVSFRGSEPAIGLNALSGGVAVRDDTLFVDELALRTEESSMLIDGAVQDYLATPRFNFSISSDKLSVPELARVVPALAGVRLQPAFELKVDGPMERMAIEANVRSTAGNALAKVVADVQAPGQAVRGTLSIRHLDLAPLLKDAKQRSDLTADASFDVRAGSFSDLESLQGTASIAAPRVVAAGYAAENVAANARFNGRRIEVDGRASAYGAAATTAGRVTLPGRSEPLSYDLKGRLAGMDLRRLPRSLNAPRATTDVSADYHVRGTEGASARTIDGDLRFLDSEVPGARIAAGSTAGFSVRGADIAYSADANVANVDLQRIGEAFDVPALADPRYRSDINGHVVASGRGTNPREMDVTASGTLSDTTVFGGRLPSLTFDAGLAADTARVTANGSFAGFDPAVLSGKPGAKGEVGGTLTVEATVAGVSSGVTLDSVEATAQATLEPSTIGGLHIESARLGGDYRQREGEIRQLEIVGRDLNVTATGRLALNDSGASNLTFHADSPSLQTIGQMFDTPVAGIAQIDGTITGNASELRASGTAIGSSLDYNGNGALSLSTKYDVRVPDLAFERAHVEADSQATFVSIAGQDVNELSAKTVYDDKRIDFELRARQPQRTLDGRGAVVLHPEHQEIHLQQLGLSTAGQQWQLRPGTEAAIQYGGNALTVDNLRLVSGDQEIAADGAFGRPQDALRVTMTNVDLAAVDALLLRPPQFSGRLDASADLTGTREAPQVKGEFAVSQGGFRQFKYDAFTGNAHYTARGITLDTRLQQNPTQWITAKGYLPVALFSRPSDDAPADAASAHDAPAAEDRVDLAIDSSAIDLGVVQGFTTALTDVRGTLEAHVRVRGSAADPRPEGTIAVQDGALTVAPTGVSYTNIAGRVDLQADRVHIDQITVLDNHQSALTVTGDLAVRERQVGNVELYVTADDFKVVDNDLGNVRLESRMQLNGTLSAPRLAGYLGMTTGEIDLDEIIALTGPSPYRTSPATLDAGASDGEAPAPSVFDALAVDVDVHVPNALVVQAQSLQTPGSPISLGALNVTLGGDLKATKKPGDQVRLVGDVHTVRGNYDFQGRRFEILRDGAVRFEGLDELDPTLDLRTRRLIRGVEARVNIRGTLKKPEVVLSSTPPLEQGDILALIVFNQPLNELGEGEQVSLVQRAQALATGAVAGQIAQSIGSALNLDTFEINLAPETGGGPELVIGQQVGQNLYVRVEQGVGERASTNLILEYEITNWLRLQSNVRQGVPVQQSLFERHQGSGVDLIFFFSY